MKMTFYKDPKNGDVYEYDEEQMSYVNLINSDGFVDDGSVPEVFFAIRDRIATLKLMTKKEIEDHINPKLTKEEIVNIAEGEKKLRINEATFYIDPMKDALDGGYIDDGDIQRLKDWQRYRYAVTKVDPSMAPDIEWPVKPE